MSRSDEAPRPRREQRASAGDPAVGGGAESPALPARRGGSLTPNKHGNADP
jgi:hypothetical protein